MEQLNINENVDAFFHSLESFTQNDGVIGKAVVKGNKTLMPVVSITIGYGGGNAPMAASGSNASGTTPGALGLGAKLNTEAVIVIDDQSQDISMLPMSTSGVSQIAEKIPQILSGMNQNKQSGQASQQMSGQS